MRVEFEVTTSASSEGKIVQDMTEIHNDVRALVSRRVIDTQDAQVRRALIQLGWRHDGGIAALDIANTPSKQNPLGTGYHRVTADDVRKMENQIRLIADALHL